MTAPPLELVTRECRVHGHLTIASITHARDGAGQYADPPDVCPMVDGEGPCEERLGDPITWTRQRTAGEIILTNHMIAVVGTKEPCVDCKRPIAPGQVYAAAGPRHIGACPR